MPLRILAVLLASLTLIGCTEEGTYPISGEECSAEDAVQDLSATDCTVPGATAGGSV